MEREIFAVEFMKQRHEQNMAMAVVALSILVIALLLAIGFLIQSLQDEKSKVCPIRYKAPHRAIQVLEISVKGA